MSIVYCSIWESTMPTLAPVPETSVTEFVVFGFTGKVQRFVVVTESKFDIGVSVFVPRPGRRTTKAGVPVTESFSCNDKIHVPTVAPFVIVVVVLRWPTVR